MCESAPNSDVAQSRHSRGSTQQDTLESSDTLLPFGQESVQPRREMNVEIRRRRGSMERDVRDRSSDPMSLDHEPPRELNTDMGQTWGSTPQHRPSNFMSTNAMPANQRRGTKTPFRCQICTHREFVNEEAAVQHMNALNHWAPFQCSQRQKPFWSNMALQKHLTDFDHRPVPSKTANLNASSAALSYQSGPLRTTRLNAHSDAIGYQSGQSKKCEVCSGLFHTHEELKAHIDALGHRISFGQLNKCETCSAQFEHHAALKAHLDVSDHRSKLRCNVCDKLLPSESALGTHRIAKRHCLPKYPCETCGEEFSEKQTCVGHMNVKKHWAQPQAQAQAYKCLSCVRTFATAGALQTHQNLAHKVGLQNEKNLNRNVDRPYCRTCSRHFVSPEVLQTHLASSTVHNRRTLKCFFCTQTFPGSAALCDHLEQGRCIGAPPGVERATMYKNIQRRDVWSVITVPTKERSGGNGASKGVWGLALATVFNGHAYACPFCSAASTTGNGLQEHLESSAHGGTIYYCPNASCARMCPNLTSLFAHLESGSCKYMDAGKLPKHLEFLLRDTDIVTFT